MFHKDFRISLRTVGWQVFALAGPTGALPCRVAVVSGLTIKGCIKNRFYLYEHGSLW